MKIHEPFKTAHIKILLGVVIVIIASIFVFSRLRTSDTSKQPDSNQVIEVELAPSGISFPEGWQEAAKVSLTNKQIGVVSEAARSNPSAKVIIRETLGDLADNFDITKLPDQVVTSLESEIDGFKLTTKGLVKIGSYDVAKIEYKAPGADQRDYMNAMFIVPTPKKTFFITYQTTENLSDINGDIDKINQLILSQYIQTHL